MVSPPVNLLKYQQLKRENEELKRIIGMITLDLEEEKKEKYLAETNNKSLLASLLGISRNRIYYHKIFQEKDLASKKAI